MKKRLLALLLVLVLLIPAGVASAATRYRVNTSAVKVRMMPSESAAVLGSYRLDYVLTIQSTKNGSTFNGYVRCVYDTWYWGEEHSASTNSVWLGYKTSLTDTF